MNWFPKGIRAAEWIMILFTAATAAAAIAGVFVAHGQLKEMQSSSKQASDLVTATQNLATAEAKQEADTQGLVRAAHDQVLAAQAQATAMDRLRAAGEAQASAMDKLRSAGELQATAAESLADAGRSQATSTASLATATGRQLAAIQAQADAARSQAEAVGRQADATVVASKATDRLADAGQAQSVAVLQSLATAKEANGIALDASLAADRPWVGAALPPPGPHPIVGQDFTFEVPVSNSGRGPALNVTFNSTMEIVPVSPPPHLGDLPSCINACSSATLFPAGAFGGAGLSFHPTILAAQLTADEVKRLDNFTDVIIMRARIDYKDSRGRPHFTVACSYYMPKLAGQGGFTSCVTGNNAN